MKPLAKFLFIALMFSSYCVNASKQASNQEDLISKIAEADEKVGFTDFYSSSSGTFSVNLVPSADIELSEWGDDNERDLDLSGTGFGIRFKGSFYYVDYYKIEIDNNIEGVEHYNSISLGINIVPPLFYVAERYVLYSRLSAGLGGADVKFSELEDEVYMLVEAGAEIGLLFDKHYSVSLSAGMQGSIGTDGSVGTTSLKLELGYMF